MSDLPDVEPMDLTPKYALDDNDVKEVLKGLKPGWYTTRMLFPRYEAWAAREQKPLASPGQFGIVMKRITTPPGNIKAHNNVRLWWVSEDLTSVSEVEA